MSILSWMNRAYSKRARRKRGEIFVEYMKPREQDKILDLGGGDGSHFASICPFRKNVTVSDISTAALRRAEEKYGFSSARLNEVGPLPFPDKHFDIVFCSSVIEHVTGSKSSVNEVRSSKEFMSEAFEHQRMFAAEIRRIGKRFFVQTPYKYFPIESHTWLPIFVVMLSRPQQMRLIRSMNSWWPKKISRIDWNLLTRAQMQDLFFDCEIVPEKSMGLTKSLMAIKH